MAAPPASSGWPSGGWRKNGGETTRAERSAEPCSAQTRAMAARSRRPATTEVEHLQRALAAEMETSAFYRRMVGELSDERQKLFARFLEIEEGHVAIVQAEIDAVSGSGFWFDMMEFDVEKG